MPLFPDPLSKDSLPPRECPGCGRHYIPSNNQQICCSGKCYTRYWRHKNKGRRARYVSPTYTNPKEQDHRILPPSRVATATEPYLREGQGQQPQPADPKPLLRGRHITDPLFKGINPETGPAAGTISSDLPDSADIFEKFRRGEPIVKQQPKPQIEHTDDDYPVNEDLGYDSSIPQVFEKPKDKA